MGPARPQNLDPKGLVVRGSLEGKIRSPLEALSGRDDEGFLGKEAKALGQKPSALKRTERRKIIENHRHQRLKVRETWRHCRKGYFEGLRWIVGGAAMVGGGVGGCCCCDGGRHGRVPFGLRFRIFFSSNLGYHAEHNKYGSVTNFRRVLTT